VNFEVMTARGLKGVTVSESEVRAQRLAFAKLRLVIEPGGAAALAAVLAEKVPADGRTAVLLSGGNVDPASFLQVIASSS
jgi:threonine dehydratase